MSSSKLSFFAATLISINIMLGTGAFTNVVGLSQKTGAASCLLFLITGIIMLPLVLSMARLSAINQQAHFYTFGALMHPFLGFISMWSYFFAKLASASFSMHVFIIFLQKTVPALDSVSTLALDIILIMLFVLLNTLRVQIGKIIQTSFLSIKIGLFSFAITVGLWKMQLIHVASPFYIWSGIPTGIPLILFCFLGFEASCSITNLIQDPQKNAPRAIITGFSIVVMLLTLYQFLFYGAVGAQGFTQTVNYTNAFPLLIAKISPSLIAYLAPFFSIAIGISALGGAYGIMYINGWNLYKLAEKNLVPFSSFFSTLNKHNIPTACIMMQGLTCIFYLVTTYPLGLSKQQFFLQNSAVLGSAITYAISVLGFYKQTKSGLAIAGLATCFVILGVSLNGFVQTSLVPFFIFCAILIIGSMLYCCRGKE